MSDINIKKMILKFGEKPEYQGNRKLSNVTVCQGCGELIRSGDKDLQ